MNFYEFNVADTLDYISYCAFRCNGTVLIAEIHRRIMRDINKYSDMLDHSDSFYEFLIAVNREITPLSPGSCTENRFNFSQGSNVTAWNTKQKDLLELCLMFYKDPSTTTSQTKLQVVASSVIKILVSSSNFKGVGAMGANQFLHLTAILGLTPLSCYNYSELKSAKLGPAQLIHLANPGKQMKLNDVQEYFVGIFSDLKKIWGVLITLALLENLLCEISRCINHTHQARKSNSGLNMRNLDYIVTAGAKLKESKKVDLVFVDERRGSIQNFFRVTMTSKNSCGLRPMLLMKESKQWENLTNWTLNNHDNKMVWWGSSKTDMTLHTLLHTSKKFEDIMRL